MGDVLTGISIAVESLSICVKTIIILKKFYASVKDAREELTTMLNLIEKTRTRLEFIKVTLFEMKRSGQSEISATFVGTTTALKTTLRDLITLASSISNTGPDITIAKRFKWGVNKSKAQAIIQRLEKQEKDITEEFILFIS
jgi:hypothetical protein